MDTPAPRAAATLAVFDALTGISALAALFLASWWPDEVAEIHDTEA